MSSRTVSRTVAACGSTSTTSIPNQRLKVSFAIIADTTRSASACSSRPLMPGSREEAALVTHHSAQQRTRTISILAVLRVQSLEPAQHAGESELIRPREQALRVIYPFGHREIDVFGRRDAHEHGVHSLGDQQCQNALEDEQADRSVLVRLGPHDAGAVIVVAAAALASEKARLDHPLLRQ